MPSNPEFDVFLCHNSKDKPAVKEIAELLKSRGLRPWLDEWELRPGLPWQRALEEQIETIGSAAVFVGGSGQGPWQRLESEAFLREFVDRDCPVIPVILPTCRKRPKLPVFLRGMMWVDFRRDEPDPLEQLIWGITGDRSAGNRQTSPNPRTEGLPAPNPFSQTLGIRDPAFFIGREAELRRLRAMLAGGSVALLGEPKIGKSSLLWQLARSWDGEVLGLIDLQAIEDRDDFYDALARELDVTESGWRPLRRALRERQALLLLDELDEGPGLGLGAADLGRLRAVCGQNPGFKLLAVSRSPLKDLYPDSWRGSPAYNFLQPLSLGEMGEEEARRLLRHPWAPEATGFDESTVVELLELAGGHPFKLQRAAFHRYENLFAPGYAWRQAWRIDMEQML